MMNDMLTELSNANLEKVNGGLDYYRPDDPVMVHEHCGGIIDDPLFGQAECTRCHESHWYLADFRYCNLTYEVWEKVYNH